jgi:hypothetical protein
MDLNHKVDDLLVVLKCIRIKYEHILSQEEKGLPLIRMIEWASNS